ncbi:MAG: hypothetical protein V1792_07800 [Pseudomonadota bacterium]
MVRMAGDHDARQTSHYLMLQDDLMIVNKNKMYVSGNPGKLLVVTSDGTIHFTVSIGLA